MAVLEHQDTEFLLITMFWPRLRFSQRISLCGKQDTGLDRLLICSQQISMFVVRVISSLAIVGLGNH